jgi:hypothetical protein
MYYYLYYYLFSQPVIKCPLHFVSSVLYLYCHPSPLSTLAFPTATPPPPLHFPPCPPSHPPVTPQSRPVTLRPRTNISCRKHLVPKKTYQPSRSLHVHTYHTYHISYISSRPPVVLIPSLPTSNQSLTFVSRISSLALHYNIYTRAPSFSLEQSDGCIIVDILHSLWKLHLTSYIISSAPATFKAFAQSSDRPVRQPSFALDIPAAPRASIVFSH